MSEIKLAIKNLLKDLVKRILADVDIPIVPESIEVNIDLFLENGLDHLIDELLK